MSDQGSLRLDHQLCFALYAATNAITRSYRASLGSMGLTYPQYLVLITLMEHASMTSGELARALKLDAGTLTPMLKRLAAAGLIKRTRRAVDERVIDNVLTPQGSALQDELTKVQAGVECRTGLAPEELAALRDKLHELTAALLTAPENAMEPA